MAPLVLLLNSETDHGAVCKRAPDRHPREHSVLTTRVSSLSGGTISILLS